jgi:hypothetical protein
MAAEEVEAMFVTAEASEGASITDLRRRPQMTEMLTEDRITLLSVVTALVVRQG